MEKYGLKEQTLALVTGIEQQSVGLSQVIEWADNYIVQSSQPEYEIIEIALSKSLPNILPLLRSICVGADIALASELVLGYLYNALKNDKLDFESVARSLYFMSMEDFEPNNDIGGDMLFFWDGIDLAKDGYFDKNSDQIIQDMVNLLEKYKFK
jgi:hypothetical protein